MSFVMLLISFQITATRNQTQINIIKAQSFASKFSLKKFAKLFQASSFFSIF